MGPGNFLTQASHFPDVLFTGKGMDHRSGGEEQKGLEEGMRHEVKDGGGIRAHAASQERVSQLADSRIGQDALDVGLNETDRGGKECGYPPDQADYSHGRRREIENG